MHYLHLFSSSSAFCGYVCFAAACQFALFLFVCVLSKGCICSFLCFNVVSVCCRQVMPPPGLDPQALLPSSLLPPGLPGLPDDVRTAVPRKLAGKDYPVGGAPPLPPGLGGDSSSSSSSSSSSTSSDS